jgi:glycosyltransferase involved in cell wall biosynthesis
MTEPVRVLHVTSRLNVGGLARLVLMACERLDPSRFETLLVTGRVAEGEGDILEVEKRDASRVRVIPELGRNPAPAGDLVAFRSLYRVVREFRPQIVHTHATKAGTLGRVAASAARVPVRVHSYHGHVFSGYFSPLVSRAVVGVERALGGLTTAIAVPGESQAREIAGVYRIAPRRKVHVVPYGVDTTFYGTLPPDRAAVRRRLDVPGQARIVGAVGRMAPVKNHALLMDAFDRMATCRGYEDVHLLIVGGGECRAMIEARAGRSPVAARIHFTGWLQDLRDAYSAIDVLALTSLNEGMPVAAMEAMASGVPVVSTMAGGVVDLIAPGQNGLLVSGFGAMEFSDALASLLADRPLRARLAERAKTDIASTHSDDAHVRALENLYESLIP